MFKNVAGQKITVFVYDYSTGAPKTGDAANLTLYLSKDDAAVTPLDDASATEADSTNAKGCYVFDLSQTETNADKLVFTGKSTTSNVAVRQETIYTRPAAFGIAGGAAGGVMIAGSNAATTLASFTCSGLFTISDGLDIYATTTKRYGMRVRGPADQTAGGLLVTADQTAYLEVGHSVVFVSVTSGSIEGNALMLEGRPSFGGAALGAFGADYGFLIEGGDGVGLAGVRIAGGAPHASGSVGDGVQIVSGGSSGTAMIVDGKVAATINSTETNSTGLSIQGDIAGLNLTASSASGYALDTTAGGCNLRTVTGIIGICELTVASWTSNSVTFSSGPSQTDALKDCLLFREGSLLTLPQANARICTAYNGTTKVATIKGTWITNPSAGTKIMVVPAAWLAGASQAWDELAADHVVAGSVGEAVGRIPTDPADASDIAASFATVNSTLSTIAAYIDTEVAAIKAVTDQFTAAQAEPTVVPAANATPLEKIAWIAMIARNKITQTFTQQSVLADNETTVVGAATVSDDGSTYTRGAFA